MIRYTVRMAELLTDSQINQDNGDKLAVVCNILHMTEAELSRLKQANATKTARSIVRAFYPLEIRATMNPDSLDNAFRDAIHGKIFVLARY